MREERAFPQGVPPRETYLFPEDPPALRVAMDRAEKEILEALHPLRHDEDAERRVLWRVVDRLGIDMENPA